MSRLSLFETLERLEKEFEESEEPYNPTIHGDIGKDEDMSPQTETSVLDSPPLQSSSVASCEETASSMDVNSHVLYSGTIETVLKVRRKGKK